VGQLNTDLIAAAAFSILKKRGVAGFTMRAVARALSVTPMALYGHVRDKAGLAELVVNAAIIQRPLPAPTGVWQEDLWMIARWTRESRHAHPALAELQRAYRIWTPAMFQHAERWVSLWQQSGLDPEQALLAAGTSSLAIAGLVDQESIFREWVRPKHAMLSSMPNARRLLTADYEPAKSFELGVRSIIEGLHTCLSKDQEQRTRINPAKRRRQSKS
jgi:TetR/AcrR family tetracycline transcriptional repressor